MNTESRNPQFVKDKKKILLSKCTMSDSKKLKFTKEQKAS